MSGSDTLFARDEQHDERDSTPSVTHTETAPAPSLPILTHGRVALLALALALLYFIVAPLFTLAADLLVGTTLTPALSTHYAIAAALWIVVFLVVDLAAILGDLR